MKQQTEQNTPLQRTTFNDSLPNIYFGKLNKQRIKEYRKLKEEYNVSESTIRAIFCKGADWYKNVVKQLQ